MVGSGRPRRVVLVYSRVGGGHLSAARALAEELQADGLATTKIADAYRESARFPVTLFPAAYAQLARHHPRLWSLVYQGSKHGPDSSRILGPFLRRGLNRLMAAERPDLVVSVLPAINGLLAQAAASAGARFEVVLTDWNAVHPLWVARGVDHYTTPTDAAARDLVRLGARQDAVDVVGIPIRRAFGEQQWRMATREVRRAALGLDPSMFTVLAMVGAEGSPRALRNIAELAQSDLQAQLVVVCGRNDELRQIIQHLPTRMPVHALGFVDNIADLMRLADILVTKPGGLTLAEAFASGVPVVVNDVLPGQEAGNLQYVLRRKAVEYAATPEKLTQLVGELARDSANRAVLAERGASLARPLAAGTIARNLLDRL